MHCRYAQLFRICGTAAGRAVAVGALALLVTVSGIVRPTYSASSPDDGKRVFEEMCVACHTLGQGDLVGPDLRGITERREQGWLIRFIRDPEQVTQQGDLIAKALLEKYRTPMPALGLSTQDVEAVVVYLATATPAALALPAAYLPTLAIALIALLALTVIALWAGTKRVEVRP